MEIYYYMLPGAGVIALLFAFVRSGWINRQDAGDSTMAEIAGHIRDGAMAFLKAASIACLSIFVDLGRRGDPASGTQRSIPTGSSPLVALSFIAGSIVFCIGWFHWHARCDRKQMSGPPMQPVPAWVKRSNVAFWRWICDGTSRSSVSACWAFSGLGVLLCRVILNSPTGTSTSRSDRTVTVLTGFSFGAILYRACSRVSGGGIYTKAADVGADLVGKVEAGIPEDDPRNPAVIADNVGDNVGDVAGMGADLFESYVGAIIGALVLGVSASVVGGSEFTPNLILLPMMLAAVGIVISLLCTFLVRTKEGGNPQHALDMGTWVAAGAMLVATFLISRWLAPETYVIDGQEFTSMGIFLSTIAGLAAGVGIGLVTQYYTSEQMGPAQSIAHDSETGSATNIIGGLAVGMQSTAIPIIILIAAVLISYDQARTLRNRDCRARHALDHRDPARGRCLRPGCRQRRRHRRDGGSGRGRPRSHGQARRGR